jgi:hypothetical protein
MHKGRMVLVAFAVLSLIIGISVAYGAGEDTETETSTASLIIPHTAKLAISNQNPSKTLIQDDTSEDAYDAGFVEMDATYPTLTVTSNMKWKLTAKVTTAWPGVVAGDGSTYVKAVGDLLVKDAGSNHVTTSSYTPLSDSTDLEMASAAIGVKNESHPCQYKILLDYTKDVPGTYTTTVTYTLATLSL